MSEISDHCDSYKQALRSGDNETLLREKTWLTTTVAAALLEQDTEAMRQIRACCADLSPLADRFDGTGKPGDRWRTLGDLLSLALHSGRPLEQLRLALPSTVGGLLLDTIRNEPGITPKTLAAICAKSPTHVANELKKLENAGLVTRLKRGRQHELFLSILGKETLDAMAPPPAVAQAKPEPDYRYIDRTRIQRLSPTGTAPVLPFARPAADRKAA